MMFIVLLAIAYFVELISAYIFFCHVGEKKLKPVYCLLTGCGLYYFAMIINLLGGNKVWLNMIFFITATLLFGCLSFKIKFNKVLLYSIMLVAICSVWEYCVEIVVASLTDKELQSYLTDEFMMTMIVVFGKGLYFLSTLILSRFIKRGNQVRIPLSLYLYPFSVIISLMAIWYVCRSGEVNTTGQFALSIVTLLLFVPVVFLFFTYQQSIEKENELMNLKSEMDKAETEKIYYNIIEKQNDDLKKYAKDTQNHLDAIRRLNSDPQIEEYINKMTESLLGYSKERQSK